MKKRFLSIVLAVLMLLSVMPVTAMAADRTTVNTAQNGIEATKTAKWVNEKEGIAEITITVKGEPPEVSTPEVDAVLVIDLSGSMNDNNKLNDAKAAAKKFVDKFFGKDAPASYKKSVRIAVVGYNGYAKAYADLTEAKDADALYTLFGSGYGSLSAGGGTNIQDGIYRAQQILKNGRAGAKKVMVVLSDGEPTYSFDANVAHTFGQNEETYGVKKNNFLYVVSEIDHTGRVGSGSAYATGDYHYYYYYCTDDKNGQQYYYVQNHGVGTVSEAYWAKKDGTTIYSIGFGISQYESGGYGRPQRETDVYKVAQSLASDDKKFKLAKDGGELGNVFDGIANEVAKYTAYNPTVIDTMGKNFEVVSNSLPTDKKVTLKSDGSLEWDITDGELDTTEHKLTFQVKYDKTKLTDDEMLLTNGEAKLIYSKTEGGEQNQEQPITSGQVENLAFTVTYLDETGAKLTSAPYTETRYWYGDTVAIEKGPVKTGYDFTVWTVTGVTPAEGATSFDMPKNNVTLKANYTEKDYLLSTGVYYISDNVVPPDSVLYSYSSVGSPRLKKDAQVTLPDFVDVQDSEHDGVWKFRGWYEYYGLSTARKYEGTFTMPARDVSLDAVWTFQKNERVNVDYEYAVDDDCDGKYTLPTELTPPAAESIIKGRTATPKTLSEAEKTYSTTEGTWSFTGWTPEKHENVTEDVTFTGKWHFTPYERVNVDYEYAVDDDCDGKYTLPTELTPPAAESIIKGRTATPKTLSEAEKTYSTTEGTWSFTGWTPEKHENVTENVTFTGKWHFTENEPKETTYSIKYYRQDADGKYSNKPYYTRTMTDAGVPLKGNVGDTVKIEDLEPFYKEHYKGYEFDEDAENVRSLQLKADANENVLKLYYKAEALMTLDKDYVAYRDGEELDLSDGEELKAGDVIQYTITLKNTGTRNLTNVTVEDTFTGAEGELVFISGDAYEIDEDTGIISLKDTLKPGETVDIRADYEVQLNDSGWRITNEVLGDATELPPAGKPHASVTITPEALKNYEIHVSADKYVKSVKGTFNKDEEDVDFTFAVSSDKRGKNELDRFDITVDESVKAGETSSRFDGGITIRLTEEEFDDLKWETFEGDGKKYPVVYLREVKGSDKKMRYDTSVVTLYLLVPQVIVTSHDPIYKTTSLNAWVDPTDSTLWPEFTNVYGKESSSSDTVKVGPQLNRDDHVAYIMGYPDGTVQPKGEITRAEACTIFFRLLTESSRDYYFSKTNDYTDVNAGDWFNNAISTLSNAGIVTGYNDGTFRPNQPITRGEMAKIIANFANLNKGTKSFTDLSGHWSKTYVELAAGNGWIAGYPDGSFRPDQKITRAETVTMINRVLERVPAKELRLLSRSIMLTFPDNNPGDWYYIAIQEASNSHEYQRSVYETTGDEMWTKLIDNVDWTKLEK